VYACRAQTHRLTDTHTHRHTYAGDHNSLKPNSITLAGSELVRSWFEAKFHCACAIWIEPASNQLRTSSEPAPNQLRTGSEPDSLMEFGREPGSSCEFAASKLDDRPNFSSNQLRTGCEPVRSQLRTSYSVMEFGFYISHRL